MNKLDKRVEYAAASWYRWLTWLAVGVYGLLFLMFAILYLPGILSNLLTGIPIALAITGMFGYLALRVWWTIVLVVLSEGGIEFANGLGHRSRLRWSDIRAVEAIDAGQHIGILPRGVRIRTVGGRRAVEISDRLRDFDELVSKIRQHVPGETLA